MLATIFQGTDFQAQSIARWLSVRRSRRIKIEQNKGTKRTFHAAWILKRLREKKKKSKEEGKTLWQEDMDVGA